MTNTLALATVDTFRNKVIHMEAETLLRSLPENSIHAIICSPPYYGLRSYLTDDDPAKSAEIGLEDTPDRYVARLVALFELARRALRDDGVLWLNLGDSYAGNGPRAQQATEADIRHATVGALLNKSQHRVGGIDGLKPKDLIGIPFRVAFALQAAGWWLRSDIIWHKPNPMPESVTDRPTKAHEYVFLLTKAARYFYDADAIREDHKPESIDRMRSHFGAVRDRYSTNNDNAGNFDNYIARETGWGNPAGRNRRTVWTVPTDPRPFKHFAMFPQALIEPMILAGCPAQVCAACGAGWARVVESKSVPTRTPKANKFRDGNGHQRNDVDVVRERRIRESITLGFAPTCDCNAPAAPGICLDPFMGSGTTALVAQRLGRDFIGCDVNAEYVALANERLHYHGEDSRMVQESEAGVKQLALLA